MLAVARGGHPKKPPAAKSLGFSDELWELVKSCWSRSSSARPTAEKLLNHLSHASLTWVPPPLYPVTDLDINLGLSGSLCMLSANSTNEVEELETVQYVRLPHYWAFFLSLCLSHAVLCIIACMR